MKNFKYTALCFVIVKTYLTKYSPKTVNSHQEVQLLFIKMTTFFNFLLT